MESTEKQDKPVRILTQITLRVFSNTKSASIGEIKTEADKKMLILSKHLLDCKEFKAISNFDNGLLAYIQSMSIPSLFKNGVYQIRPMAVPVLDDYLRTAQIERNALVEALVKEYDRARASAQTRLGPQFNINDYPSPEKLRAKYSIDWRFFTLDAPQALASVIDPEFIRAEGERLTQMFKQAEEEGMILVRTQLKGLVDHLVDKLTPDADGNKKKLHKSAVTKLTDFLANFDFKNVAGDRDLQVYIDQCKSLMAGIDPATLQASDGERAKLSVAFESVKKEITDLVTKGPKRFVDEEMLRADVEDAVGV